MFSLLAALIMLSQTPDFVLSDSIGLSGSTQISFIDITDGKDTQWDFGDGSIGKGKQASHVYASDGIFRVKMKSGGKEYVREAAIKIIKFPKTIFSRGSNTIHANKEVIFSDISDKYDGSDIVLVKSTWDLGDGTSFTGDRVVHKYSAPKEYSVRLKKTFKVSLGGKTYFKDSEYTEKIRVLGVALFVDSGNVTGKEDGTSWDTAFTSLKNAIASSGEDSVGAIFVSKNPIVLEVGIQDEYGIVIPDRILVSGGYDPKAEGSVGPMGIPVTGFTGEYTPITLKSISNARSLKSVVMNRGAMSGFIVSVENNRFTSISGIHCSSDSSIMSSVVTVTSKEKTQRGFYGIRMEKTSNVSLSGISLSGSGWGVGGCLLSLSGSSNVVMDHLTLSNMSSNESDAGPIQLKNPRNVVLSNSSFVGNKSGSGLILVTSDVDIKENSVISGCVFESNTLKASPVLIGPGKRVGVVVSRSVFRGNIASGSACGGIQTGSGDVRVENCLFHNNVGFLSNSIYFSGGNLRVTRSTLVNASNESKSNVDIRSMTRGMCVDNCILYTDGVYLVKEESRAARVQVFNSIAFPKDVEGSVDCVSADPGFRNKEVGDFRLSSDSPALSESCFDDTKEYFVSNKIRKPSESYKDSSDIRGVRRDTKESDLGCFERTDGVSEPSFFTDSESNGLLGKESAVMMKKTLDSIDSMNTNGVKPEVSDTVRNLVERSLLTNQ